MFTARSVGHSFGSLRVLEGVDLTAAPGELIGLSGQNGSGKSTLLRILCGHLAPTSGSVDWGGLIRGSAGFRASVVLATQSVQLDPEITGRETLDLFQALGAGGEPIPLLTRDLDRRVGSYSGGMKRRLHIMLASLSRPALLGLDEPEAGLDEQGSEQLWAWVRGLCASGSTAVIASHRLPDCDRIMDLSS